MSEKKSFYLGSLAILPALAVVFFTLRVSTQGGAIDRLLPDWYQLTIIGTMALIERIFTYKYAVSQRSVRARDISSTLVNLYVTGALAGAIFLPVIAFFPDYFFGRGKVFASPEFLGPLWLQIPSIMLFVSFFRYWMHRYQHKNEFLWSLHAYHHRVSDLQASNVLVSHPIDFALRNVLVFTVLGLIGFNPAAILIAVAATQIYGFFSHCGAGVKGGFLNYVLVTPEVHRWHHTATVPAGHRYSVNYGVEFAIWDVLFGTYYLPKEAGEVLPPERIGHPSGLTDEGNYIRLVLAPLGLYGMVVWLKRVLGLTGPKTEQPAE